MTDTIDASLFGIGTEYQALGDTLKSLGLNLSAIVSLIKLLIELWKFIKPLLP